MRTITLNIEKGGVGKTTLACHLAWYLAERGERVVVLDLDQQGNATSTLTGYEKPEDGPDEGPKVPFSVIGSIESLFRPDFEYPAGVEGTAHVFDGAEALHEFTTDYQHAIEALADNFPALAPHYDFCVIDTAPGWSWINFAGLMMTDHLIVPLQIEKLALDGLQRISDSIRTVEERGRGGRKIDFLGLVANNYRLDNRLHAANLEALKRETGDFLFPTPIPHRQHVAEAMDQAVPVWRLAKDTRDASALMTAVLDEAMKRVLRTLQKEKAA